MPLKLTFSTVFILGLLSAITPLAIDTYLPSIPTIARSIQTEVHLIQLTVSVYLMTFAIFQLLFGPMSDAYGRRKVIFIGLFFYILGSLVCSFSYNYELLMSGRIIQAFGGAAVAVCVPALVRDGLSNEQFVKAMSYVFLVMGMAPLLAPILGGIILIAFDWHYIFIFLALMTCITFFLFAVNIAETLPLSKRITFSLENILTNYAQLLKNKGVMRHILSGSLHFGGLMCFVTGSSFVYIEFYGVDEANFGLLFGISVGALILFTTVNGQLVERVGIIKMTNVSIAIMLLASCLFAGITLMKQPPLWSIVFISTLFICTIGALGSNLMVGALNHAGSNSGSVVALAGTFRFMMGAIGGAVISILHDGTFVPMISIMAACGFLSFATYVLMMAPTALSKNV